MLLKTNKEFEKITDKTIFDNNQKEQYINELINNINDLEKSEKRLSFLLREIDLKSNRV
jgi:hypothetical protein